MTAWEATRAALRLLSRRDGRLLALAALVLMCTAFLDLFGVALTGLVAALSFAIVAGNPVPASIAGGASAIGLGELSDVALLTTLGAGAALALLVKSILTPLFIARVFRFLGRREAVVSARLSKELLGRPLNFVQLRSSVETTRALIAGPRAAISIVLGQLIAAVSDLALLTASVIALLVVNPPVALGAVFFFGSIAWTMQRTLGDRIARFGAEGAHIDGLLSRRAVHEALGAYRELTVADRRSFYIDRLRILREQSVRNSVGSQVVSMLPKYTYEVALVIGGFLLAVVLFNTKPTPVAAGSFAIFLVAAARVLPALLRIQSAALSIRKAAGEAEPTFALAEDLGHPLGAPAGPSVASPLNRDGYADFEPSVEVLNVSYAHVTGSAPALCDVNLSISAGQTVALIGRSGAGKSTLADVILGVLEPDAGEVLVGGIEPVGALRRWPGAVAYVPQTVMLVDATVRDNVALGLPRRLVDDESVWEALDETQLGDLVRIRPDGLDERVGEGGLRLSGGQRQRLGIARALFTKPRLVVLDEATSALDAETEQAITSILNGLGEGVTVVVIAHRLSTVMHADLVVYLEDGRVVAEGTFEDVCARVPALSRQATLMGLRTA